ncbi:MAG: hypothetical protein RMJ66_05560 [Bacteroidia bacterium]|nr:hypothetical protein [Bacteroidia bacterium]MDW8134516.1 hypothetical protein [Bacteroidia bacterium]
MVRSHFIAFLVGLAIETLSGIILTSCQPDENLPPISLSIWRGEIALRQGLPSTEDSIKMRAFFYDCVYEGDTSVPDTVYYQDLHTLKSDSLFTWLIDTVVRRYPPSYNFLTRLSPLFQRWKALFPEDSLPQIVTFVTGYGPIGALTMEKDMAQLCQKHLMIGLHYFISDTFGFYPPDLPYFIRRRLTEPHIPVFIALRLIRSKMPTLTPHMLPKMIDYMVWHGIQLYALEKLLPELHDSLRLFYTHSHLEWLKENARYAYKELLPYFQESRYTTIQPYIGEEPFTKTLGQDSPPRLGWYFGWQAVRKYAEKKNASLRDLLRMPPSEYATLFIQSGYKP